MSGLVLGGFIRDHEEDLGSREWRLKVGRLPEKPRGESDGGMRLYVMGMEAEGGGMDEEDLVPLDAVADGRG